METFISHTGVLAALETNNIDTDQIIPKQYLKSIAKTGFGKYLFDSWRYLDEGSLGKQQRQINPDFILNQSPFDSASILVTGENFGCGSSREHAVWALYEYGIRCVIAESFSDIFFTNSFKNGLLLIQLDTQNIQKLISKTKQAEPYILNIDLEKQYIEGDGIQIDFDIDSSLKHRLLHGLDDIGMTLQYADQIKSYEQQRKNITPWLFPDLQS